MEKEKVTSQKVRSRLKELEDEKYREFHSGLLPGTENILGVRLPALRSLAKEIAKNDWEEWFFQKNDIYYEETMLRGLVTAYAKMDCDTRLSYIRAFVPDIDNWAVCDCVSKMCIRDRYKSVELMKEHIKKTMRPEVLGGIGGFSGAFSMSAFKDIEEPALVSGTDGCGTKVKLAMVSS